MDSGLAKSEEDLLHLEAKSDSFWDIGNYQKVVKRIENGARLCGDFVKMAQERADIEAKYSRGLQQWSKKWEELVSKGPEYGSMEVGWKASLKEANQVADIHAKVCSKIQHDIINGIQIWKGNHFHKSLRGLKETKKAEESFTQAQKPWLKRLQKSNRSRKSYHKAAYDLEILQGKLRLAETSSEISPEQCAKTREKCEQAETTFDKALDKYKLRLGELQHYQSRFVIIFCLMHKYLIEVHVGVILQNIRDTMVTYSHFHACALVPYCPTTRFCNTGILKTSQCSLTSAKKLNRLEWSSLNTLFRHLSGHWTYTVIKGERIH